jgi:hypothetical protein
MFNSQKFCFPPKKVPMLTSTVKKRKDKAIPVIGSGGP